LRRRFLINAECFSWDYGV